MTFSLVRGISCVSPDRGSGGHGGSPRFDRLRGRCFRPADRILPERGDLPGSPAPLGGRTRVVLPGTARPRSGPSTTSRSSSWIVLRGRCRHCGEPISVRYPAVELATGGLFAAVGWVLGPHWAVPGICVLAATLLALAAIELDGLPAPAAVRSSGRASALSSSARPRWPTGAGGTSAGCSSAWRWRQSPWGRRRCRTATDTEPDRRCGGLLPRRRGPGLAGGTRCGRRGDHDDRRPRRTGGRCSGRGHDQAAHVASSPWRSAWARWRR